MLDSLRKFATTWLGKLLGVVLLIGLAGFGISGVLTSIGTDTVASVGGQDISTREFQRAYQSQLNGVAQQMGSVPTPEQAMAFGIPSSVIGTIASEKAIAGLGERMGLGVSDDKLADLLRQDPSFSGILGQFDGDNFNRVLRMNGYTESEYWQDLRERALRQQISIAAFADLPTPNAAATLLGRYAADERVVDYFVLSSNGMVPPETPTDEELQAYLDENQTEFRTDATRTADILVLTPDILAETIEIGDDDIAAEYERRQDSLSRPETREIEQAALPDDAAIEAFEEGIGNGTDFADVVEETGVTVTSLGDLTQSGITDAGLAETAFELEEGAYAVISGPRGQRVVHIAVINEGGVPPLADVREELANSLREDRAEAQYVDVQDQIEEFRAALRPLNEIADQFGLETMTVDVTADGRALSEVPGIPTDSFGRVAGAIFDAELGQLSAAVSLSSQRNIWFDLQEITPARDETLDEVRDEITDAIMADRTAQQLAEEAETIRAQLDDGNSLEDIALSRNLFVQQSDAFNRSGNGAEIDAVVADATFNGPEGLYGAAQNSAGDYVVFEVTEVHPANEAQIVQATATVTDALRNTVYAEFVTALRDDAGVSVNQQTLNNLLALGGN